jgi:hypothetical protein
MEKTIKVNMLPPYVFGLLLAGLSFDEVHFYYGWGAEWLR